MDENIPKGSNRLGPCASIRLDNAGMLRAFNGAHQLLSSLSEPECLLPPIIAAWFGFNEVMRVELAQCPVEALFSDFQNIHERAHMNAGVAPDKVQGAVVCAAQAIGL